MTESRISVSLDAVIVSIHEDEPHILIVETDRGSAIPSGPLEPDRDPTLELALRRWITEQAGIEIGYAEQLYTFGDRMRGSHDLEQETRWLSVAYLALVRQAEVAGDASWLGLYDLFPWEDHRNGTPAVLEETIRPALIDWAGDVPLRVNRIEVLFRDDALWDGVQVLERYELLYEAELHRTVGTAMFVDHRRIAATALGRLRGKLTYRPVVFELLDETFTLTALQRTVEALSGVRLHTQNFRRLVDRTGLVEGTGVRTSATGGRPAELFRFRPEVWRERPRPGLGSPYR